MKNGKYKNLTFSKEVTIRFTGEDNFILESDLYVKTDIFYGTPVILVIPSGFKTDLASVPRIFQAFFSKTDWALMIPAIAHDYAYRKKKGHVRVFIEGKERSLDVNFTKEQADRLFKQKVRDFGGNFFTVFCVYQAVKWFGRF